MALRLVHGIQWITILIVIVSIYLISSYNYQFKENTQIKLSFVNTSSSSSPPHSTITPKRNNTIVYAAVVLSLATQASRIAEFHLLYDSWRFIQNFSPLSQQVILDLIIFCEQPSCSQLPSACLPLSYNTKLQLMSRCFYEELAEGLVDEWKDYLYMTSIAFMLTKEYRKAIFKYEWILRVDQDAVLSPALLYGLSQKHPVKLYDIQFGGIGHGTEFTYERLRKIAKKLGYNHSGIHNLCSTWLVHPQDSIQIANLTTQIGRHFLEKEFGQHVAGIENLPIIGEWPKWWRSVTSLYAAEIAINHIYSSSLGHQHESSALDHPGFSQDSVWKAWHIHCLHNEDEFSKFKHRDRLNAFLKEQQTQRIVKMSNNTFTQNILNEVINEFHHIEKNNGQMTGKITVREYVTALAWQKAYAATGAISLG